MTLPLSCTPHSCSFTFRPDNKSEGYNGAAMAYWTFIGLFTVPGHTVGICSTCQGVLIDTRSGFVLATVQGEGRREENVLPGAVSIAADRVERQARAEAINEFQKAVRCTIAELAAQGAHLR